MITQSYVKPFGAEHRVYYSNIVWRTLTLTVSIPQCVYYVLNVIGIDLNKHLLVSVHNNHLGVELGVFSDNAGLSNSAIGHGRPVRLY